MNRTQLSVNTLTPIPYPLCPPPQQQVVISFNVVADGTFVFHTPTNAGLNYAPGNRSIAWIANCHCSKQGEQGKMSHYLHIAWQLT